MSAYAAVRLLLPRRRDYGDGASDGDDSDSSDGDDESASGDEAWACCEHDLFLGCLRLRHLSLDAPRATAQFVREAVEALPDLESLRIAAGALAGPGQAARAVCDAVRGRCRIRPTCVRLTEESRIRFG